MGARGGVIDEPDIWKWSARRVCRAIAGGQISSAEYVQELLARCRRKTDLNAFIALDGEAVLRRARELDAAESKRAWHGLPVALKDAIGSARLPTTAGTPGLATHQPAEDADVVKRLVGVGAFVLGKLNMHELSYGVTSNNKHFGPVRNPFDRRHIPGGSSGGAAAAVAAGMVPVALGTDTGGSVRIPAALCGVVGFRPSAGRYPQRGIVPVSHTRDTAGPICRSVDDAAMIDAIVTGVPDRLAIPTPSDVRIGVPNRYFIETLAADTREVFALRLEELRGVGWAIEPVDMGTIQRPEEGCGFPIALYETKSGLSAYLAAFAPDGPTLEELIELVSSPDVKGILCGLLAPEFEEIAGAYRDAIANGRRRVQATFAACFGENELDALIFPTTVRTAALIGEDETVELAGETVPTFPTFIHNTDPGSIAGIPGISIPAGLSADGLPIGIALDGPAGSDRRLLAVARALEADLPTAVRPGPLT